MLLSEIINKEYRLCDLEERKKSVLYREVDLDNLLIKEAEKEKGDVKK